MEIVKISKIKPNENNPRLIKDDKFNKLVKSFIVNNEEIEGKRELGKKCELIE